MAQQRRMGGQPMFIMSEDSQRTQGRDAQSSNIMAGKAVAESVRTTLGPRGMDKMLVDSGGDVVITNDGATILNEMDIEHPAAQMIVEVSDSQEEEVGDGTTTAAVLAGNLLGEAEDLIEQDVHATTIVEGYHEAAEIALEAIDEQVNEADVDDEILRQVAESSMTGKGTGGLTAASLAETVVEAIRHVDTDAGVARDNVTVHTQIGASSNATELVPGIVIDEEPAHDGMPSEVEDASIAVLDVELDVRTGDVDAEYAIDSIDQLNAAIDAEEGELEATPRPSPRAVPTSSSRPKTSPTASPTPSPTRASSSSRGLATATPGRSPPRPAHAASVTSTISRTPTSARPTGFTRRPTATTTSRSSRAAQRPRRSPSSSAAAPNTSSTNSSAPSVTRSMSSRRRWNPARSSRVPARPKSRSRTRSARKPPVSRAASNSP